ncbi:MAG: bifunctional fucokinase/L-fucose-1-P-guanylyltransferase, partial [Bacteroidota bacterium]
MKYILSVPPSLSKSFFDIETRDPEKWFVTSDPPGKRIGSGGGTAYCLTECAKKANAGDFLKWLSLEKRIIIHAAGHGRRLPAYAPVGKILTPLPVFRWSRGQSIKQKLIDLQLQFLNQVVKKAGPRLNTMVVSGDVLIYLDDAMPDIPDADIVSLGVWKET